MSSLINADNVDRIVGVIDLSDAKAVHAVAGQRANYQPVACCRGDAVALTSHYRNLGLSSFYLADLDSIQHANLQTATIESVCRAAGDGDVVIDMGWTGNETGETLHSVVSLAEMFPQVRWVAATESMVGSTSLRDLVELLGHRRVILGLDFRAGEFITRGTRLDSWVSQALSCKVGGILVLDLASVGTRRGPSTVEACRQIRALAPAQMLLSGGGVSSAEDLNALFQAGCDQCLVATALHH